MNGKRILSFILALAMVLGMVPFNALPTFAAEVMDPTIAEVGDTFKTKTETAPTDVEYGVWVLNESTTLNPNPRTTCGITAHTHGDGCNYLGCEHYQRTLTGQPVHDKNSCYGNSTTEWEVCPGGDHAHTATESGVSVYVNQELRSVWYPIYQAAYDAYIAENGNGYLAKIAAAAHAADVVRNTTFCYTTTAPLICGHGDSCTDACCSTEVHTHDTSENGCYEYTWTLRADENNNNVIDGTEADPYYTVTYTDGVDGVELFADQVTNVVAKDGNLVKVPGFEGTPTREGYTFDGWTPAVPETLDAGNHVFTATWTPNNYTITWDAGEGLFPNGKKTITADVAYDSMPKAPENPTKAADAQYTYTFAGWDPTVSKVTGATTYTAKYDNVLNKYTVTWMNGETTLEIDENVEYGTTPEYNGATPTKDATAQYTYTFSGWSPAISTVTGEVTYYAQFTETVNTYTVTWKNGDTVLETDENVPYGTVPTYDGTTPTKTATAQYTYTFSGWSPEVSAVTGAVTYVAQFSETVNTYTITWNAGEGVFTNGEKTMTTTVAYGELPVAPEQPTKAADGQTNWNFAGWGTIVKVTGEATYTASYTEGSAVMYKVTWYDEDGTTVLFSGDFAYGTIPTYGGNAPSKAGDAQYSYSFDKWIAVSGVDNDGKITGEASYKASYTTTVNEYTVTFKGENGNVLQSGKVPYGTVPSFNGETPTKAATAQYTYTFAGWTPDVVAVTGDAEYTVKFTATANEYEITWIVDGVEEKVFVPYGTVPTHAAPTKDYYTFAGWTPAVVAVSGKASYTATWTINNDANNNNIPDETETGTVTVVIEGEGNVTLTPAGNASLVGQDGNVYTYLYDSTDDANKVINVSTSLIDTDGTDGSADYLISAPATATIGGSITVEFGDRTIGLNSTPYEIVMNKGQNASEQRQTIYDQILLSVVATAPTGTPTIYYWTNGVSGLGSGYYNVMQGGGFLNVYDTAINLSFNDGEEKVKITYPADGILPEVSVEVDVTVVDSRTNYAEITLDYVAGGYNTEDDFKDALEGSIKVNGAAYELQKLSLTPDSISYTKEADGSYTVVITIHGTDSYLETTATFTGITWTVNQYEITWVDGNGNKLYSEMLDYGATPSYTGATPVKDQTVSTTYTFVGWNEEIVAVSGNATYTAKFSEAARIYVISWDTNGDGTVDTTTEVAYGATPVAPAYAEVTNKSFAGWSPAIAAVSGEATYTATYSDDTIYHIEFMVDGVLYNEQYINVTKNPTAVIDNPGNPDKDHNIFDGWDVDVIGMTPTANVVVNAKWVAETNNNNVRDEEETVAVQVPNGGSISFSGTAPTDGAFIFDSTNNNYTIVITPPEAHYVASAEIEGVNLAARTVSVTYSNGVMTISGVALTNGDTIKVTFAKHQIPVAENPTIVVNGKDADSKLAIVTKRAVLETILGRAVSDEEFAQYEVKVMVNAAGYNGYYDIWALIDGVSGKDDVISQTALSALKSAFNTAIDVPGSENFEITWAAHDQYPEVKAVVSVALVESRKPATAEHNGTVYTATELDDALLNTIKGHITSDTGINSIEWVDPEMTLIPGTTMDVLVRVTTKENAEFYSKTDELVVKIKVPTGNIDAKIDPTATIYFNTGMSDTDKVTLVLNEVPPVYYVTGSDIIATDVVVNEPIVVKYLASTARNVPYTLNIAQLDLGVAGNFLPDTIEVQIPVDELWLPMTAKGNDFPVYEAPSNELIRDILLNELIPEYAADYIAGNITTDQLKQIAADLLAEHEEIGNYYKYLGAHQFGEFAQETIRYEIDTNYGLKITNDCVLNMVDERDEVTIKLNTGVEVVYNNYTAEELLALILDGVYFGEDKIDGLTVELVTDVEGLPASDASEITVKFAGNEAYKPATATVAVKINKAPLTLSVDNRLFKYPESLNYTLGDVIITKSNGVLVDVDTINFIAGLNISDVNIDGGLKGFVAQVQLMLPEELQSLLTSADSILQSAGLNVSFANGASMKLSELIAAVDAMDEIFAGSEYEEYFRVLLNVLQSLPTEVADIEIIIGGGLPTDIGVYLVGSISADSNYETAYGAGAIVITPDGIKAELAWNEEDDNGIITNSLLVNNLFDTGAHAVSVGEGGTIEEANKQIVELFVGLNIDELDNELKGLVIELDQTKLGVGAYVEVALISEFGNVMYYAEPIFRPIVVVAETLNVDFGDASGNVNNERHFEFFNVPQNGMEENLLVTYKQNSKDGTYAAGDVVTDYTVKYFYAGIQTNGTPYASTTAPVYAGVYTITAVVIVREDGVITHAGQGIGALVIEPSKSTTDVENEAIKWDGNPHTFNQYVTVGSVNVPTITPDKTVITVGISADLDANIGLSAIKGTVNVDLPKWFDELMSKLGTLEAGYADGITVDVFKGYVQKIQEALVELGVETESFDKVVSVINQLNGNVTLTFHDDKGYTDVGAYLVIGVVTDSDHYPSADAGIVVIYPDGEKVELEYTKTWDDNNVFTWNYLQHYDLNAQAIYNGQFDQTLTDRTVNLFVGFADHGELILTADKADLDNGVYAEVSFLLVLDNEMYYAEPIAREVVIVPNPASIDFVDENGNVNNERHFKFYNKPWAMDQVRVTLADGTVLDLTAGDEGVDIFYVGVQTNGKPYADYAAPVHAGVYEVTAQYTARDEQNRVVNLGVGVGVLVIEPAQAEINVENETHEFGSAFETESMITVSSDVNVNIDKTVITVGLKTDGTFSENGLSAIDGDINVDLPKWLDDVLANYDLFNNGLTVSEFVAGVETVKAELAELGINTEILDRLVNVVEQFPATATLTFHDQADVAPTAVGAYLVIGVVTDSNFYPAMDAGLLVIYPAVEKTELSWIYNDVNNNNIYTLDTLEHVDLSAEADIAEANQYVMNLFLGVDVENWKIALVDNQAELNIGVYEEFSFVKPNVNSIIYYAEPISRPVIVVANVYNVSIHEQVVTEMFDNTEKDMGEITVTTMAGEVVDTTKGTLTVTYVGIDTMLRPYYSTEKPVHAGTYTVIATYVGTDDEGKQAVGVGIGTLIITPADVEISVDSHAGLYGADYDLNIKTEHGAINDEAKTLTIIAGVDLSAYLTEGKLGIDSTVNVDFPEAIDNILGELFPELYVNGIGTNAFFAKYDEMVAAIQAHGYTTEVLDNLRTMLAKLNAANLTFNETTEPTESGMYAVIAMVCDPDYKFDVDTALVAISPNATVAELDFVMDMPQLLNAEILPFDMVDEFDFHAYVSALKSTNSGLNPEDIVLKDVIFGLTSDLQLFLGSSEEKPNEMGIYDQIAYAPAAENNLLAVLPIHRDFLITDSSANVVYIDPNGNVNWLREFTYGETVDMGASIMLADGTILEATPNVHYMGIENGIVFYNSTEVPTDAGLYTVIGYFVDAEQNIYTIGLGALKINPKQITVVVDDKTMTAGDELPELTYTVDGLENGDSLTVDVTTEADGTVAGTYDITAAYVCDPNYIVTVENGTLTVEEKIAIGTIQFVGPSLNLESEVHYNFDFTLNGFNMDHVVEVGLLRFYTRTDDKNDSNIYTADEVTPGYEIVDGAYRVRSNGIPAKNLGDDGWYRFYVKMSDGTYVYSDRYKYSAKIYTDTVLAGDRYTDDLKALCVSLMNYGAAAQVFFAETTEYTYETLMNAHLSDADLARVQAYSDDMIDERLAFAPSKHGEFAVHDQNVFPNGYNSHLTLLGAITYNFTIDYVAPAGSESGLLIWTQETYETAETLTWENAVEHVMDPDSPIEVAYTGNAAKNMGDTIFACGYVVIDGEYHYTSVFRTSIDTYAKKILASDSYTDSMHTLAEYMLVYGEYAKDYFITNRGE